MIEIEQTENYIKWFNSIKNIQLKAKIRLRLKSVSIGNLGDVKPIGNGLSELRFHFGAGYRIYFIQHDDILIILLGGSDKDNQQKAIELAKKLAQEIKEEKNE